MSKPAALEKLTGVASRFGAFVAERHPFALADAARGVRGGGRRAIAARRGGARRAAPGVRGASWRAGCGARPLPAGLPETTPGMSARGAARAGARRAARRVRRLPAARGDRGVAHAGRAARDPARHAADARDRQPPQDVLHRRRGALRRRARSRARASGRSARKRSTRRASGCAAAPRYRGADGAWRGDVVAPVIRDLGATLAMRPDAETVRDGAQRADGQGRAADRTARTCTSATSAGASCRRPRRSTIGDADDRRHGDGVRPRGLRARRASRSSAKADRRSASGTRRSTCARRGGCPRSSACRTTRRRSRRRSPSSRRSASSPTRRSATASPASRSTAPIPRRSPRRSRGRPSARAPGAGRR